MENPQQNIDADTVWDSIFNKATDWVLMKEKKDVQVFRRKHPNSDVKFYQWHVTVKLPISASEAADLLNNPKKRLTWDGVSTNGILTEFVIINTINEFSDIAFWVTAPVFTISAREFLVKRTHQIRADGTHVTTVVSTTLDTVPVKSGRVRAHSYLGGAIFVPTKDGGCNVHLVSCSDLKGWLPVLVINSGITGALISMLSAMRSKAVEMKKG